MKTIASFLANLNHGFKGLYFRGCNLSKKSLTALLSEGLMANYGMSLSLEDLDLSSNKFNSGSGSSFIIGIGSSSSSSSSSSPSSSTSNTGNNSSSSSSSTGSPLDPVSNLLGRFLNNIKELSKLKRLWLGNTGVNVSAIIPALPSLLELKILDLAGNK